MSEQVKIVSLQKKIRNTQRIMLLGKVGVLVGVCTISAILFNFINGSSIDIFGIFGNVFLFLGLGLNYYGLKRQIKLKQELNRITTAIPICPIVEKKY